jgi:hypothetical protein
LKIEYIAASPALRIANLNNRSAVRAARILHQPDRPPAPALDETEIGRMSRQHRVALKSPPLRRLPGGGG